VSGPQNPPTYMYVLVLAKSVLQLLCESFTCFIVVVVVASEEYKKPCNITGDNGKMAMTAAAKATTSIVKLERAPKYKIVSMARRTQQEPGQRRAGAQRQTQVHNILRWLHCAKSTAGLYKHYLYRFLIFFQMQTYK